MNAGDVKIKVKRINYSSIIILTIGVAVVVSLASNFAGRNAKIEIAKPDENEIQKKEKPVILNDNLPIGNRRYEELGDKLAAASVFLRQRQTDSALKILSEVDREISPNIRDENRELYQLIADEFSKARIDVQQGKIKDANQEINRLINRLDARQN